MSSSPSSMDTREKEIVKADPVVRRWAICGLVLFGLLGYLLIGWTERYCSSMVELAKTAPEVARERAIMMGTVVAVAMT